MRYKVSHIIRVDYNPPVRLAHQFGQFGLVFRRCLVLRHAILVADPVAPNAALFEIHARPLTPQ